MTEKLSHTKYYIDDLVFKVKHQKRISYCQQCDLTSRQCYLLRRPCMQHDPLFCVLRLVR